MLSIQQEEQIRMLRSQGVGYRNIGKIVHLPRDKVRNYCKIHNLSGHQEAVKVNIQKMTEDKTVCTYCGAKLMQKNTGRPPKFCCGDCRRKWWAQNREQMKESTDAIYSFTCKHCGKSFTDYGKKKRVYCSHNCYIRDRFWSEEDEATR